MENTHRKHWKTLEKQKNNWNTLNTQGKLIQRLLNVLEDWKTFRNNWKTLKHIGKHWKTLEKHSGTLDNARIGKTRKQK